MINAVMYGILFCALVFGLLAALKTKWLHPWKNEMAVAGYLLTAVGILVAAAFFAFPQLSTVPKDQVDGTQLEGFFAAGVGLLFTQLSTMV